jgi:gliding motility-associated-like protein
MIPFRLRASSKICVFRLFPCHYILVLACLTFCFAPVYGQDSTARNKKPKIVGQRELTINEGETITIELNDLIVEDADDWFYPWGFTLSVYDGDNYTEVNNAVTPVDGFEGELTVPVKVNDGRDDSEKYNLRITVIGDNDPPTITGQQVITGNEDQPFTLEPSHLIINDPDTEQFTLIVSNGTNYTVSGNVINPAPEFNGVLSIPVQVSDGEFTTEAFPLQLSVIAVNDKPIITGQQALEAAPATPLRLELSHCTVQDPDNTYPADFTLSILNGDNYAVSGYEVIPSETFEGALPVAIRVNDGINDSDIYNLTINVKKGNRVPVITNQEPVIINEDQSFTLTFSHLKVDDNDNYPEGFSITVSPGENFTVSNTTITPAKDFFGNIFTSVQVSDGEKISDPFNFQITVRPINDAPELNLTDTDSIDIIPGKGAVQLFKNVFIEDIDNDSMALAEIGFRQSGYESGRDLLQFSNTSNIKGFFDSQNGILALIGKASTAEYEQALESVLGELQKDITKSLNKGVHIIVNDGQANSNKVVKEIIISETNVNLEIPTGFTPNGDLVNDTWSIRPRNNQELFSEATIRVYSRSGQLVFEANGLEREWDGRYNGNVLPADVYYYTIDLNIPDEMPALKGIVTILR